MLYIRFLFHPVINQSKRYLISDIGQVQLPMCITLYTLFESIPSNDFIDTDIMAFRAFDKSKKCMAVVNYSLNPFNKLLVCLVWFSFMIFRSRKGILIDIAHM